MVINGTNGPDTLVGTSSDDTISGGGGDDIIDGAGGNDTLDGGANNNTYLFGKGDGADFLKDRFDGTAYTGNSLGKLNTLEFKAGVAVSEVTAARSGDSLTFKINGFESFTVQSFFYQNDPRGGYNTLQQVRFANGTLWDLDRITTQAFVGSAGADNIVGTVYNDTIDGGGGNDTLDGGAGRNNYLFGKGDGADYLKDRFDGTAYTGNDLGKLNTLQFKPGVAVSDVTASRSGDSLSFKINGLDTFTVQSYFYNNDARNGYNTLQQVKFADGTVWALDRITTQALVGSPGADNLIGTVADDTLDGSGGNDTLEGGPGRNTYLFGKGDGADYLKDRFDGTAYTGNELGKLNTLQFKTGVSVSEVTASRSGDSLTLKIAGLESFTVQSYFYNNDARNGYNTLQQVKFADGTVWDLDRVTTQAFTGTAGNDSLVGTVAGDAMDGGPGNDTLAGGPGNNTYLFGKGDGFDTLVERFDATAYTGNNLGKLNTLQFKTGVLPSEITVALAGSNLVVKVLGVDRLTAQNFGTAPATNNNNPLQQFKFADGTVWDLAKIQAQLPTSLNGTPNGDSINGTLGNDAINAGAGDDRIRGATGNDVVDGGPGIDTALYTLQRKDYTILKNPEGFTIAAKAGSEGTDLLSNVERVAFGDTRLAFDIDGNAGKVAKILGAVFGPASLAIREYVGIGLGYIDSGMSYEALCALALQAAGKTSSADIVETLWLNVVGSPIPASEKTYYTSLLNGGMTAGTLTVFAADTDINVANIQLAGLAQTGLEFIA